MKRATRRLCGHVGTGLVHKLRRPLQDRVYEKYVNSIVEPWPSPYMNAQD